MKLKMLSAICTQFLGCTGSPFGPFLLHQFHFSLAHHHGPSVGEPGAGGANPRPPNIGRMYVSSNLRQYRCTL